MIMPHESSFVLNKDGSVSHNGLIYRSFKSWSRLGYKIKPGAVSTVKINGIPVFSNLQIASRAEQRSFEFYG